MVRVAVTHIVSLRGLFLKAGALGFLWLFLPFWIFLAASFYFYFFPFFQPLRLALPFFLTLVTAAIRQPADPGNFWFGLFLAALFFLILGIKNLIFVNRFGAHQLLVFFLLFLSFLSFFSGFETWQRWLVSLFALGVSAVFLLLAKELADYYFPHVSSSRRRTFLTIGLGALFIWQLCLTLLFLPLNYFYETALLFLSAVLLLDVLLEHLKSQLNRKKVLTDFSIFFVFATIVLASAKWGF